MSVSLGRNLALVRIQRSPTRVQRSADLQSFEQGSNWSVLIHALMQDLLVFPFVVKEVFFDIEATMIHEGEDVEVCVTVPDETMRRIDLSLEITEHDSNGKYSYS